MGAESRTSRCILEVICGDSRASAGILESPASPLLRPGQVISLLTHCWARHGGLS